MLPPRHHRRLPPSSPVLCAETVYWSAVMSQGCEEAGMLFRSPPKFCPPIFISRLAFGGPSMNSDTHNNLTCSDRIPCNSPALLPPHSHAEFDLYPSHAADDLSWHKNTPFRPQEIIRIPNLPSVFVGFSNDDPFGTAARLYTSAARRRPDPQNHCCPAARAAAARLAGLPATRQ